ncbi:MAG: FecR family protein [Pseudomonadota bacterium]
MQKPLPVEVETVSARRWARLERSLFARWDEEQRLDAGSQPVRQAPARQVRRLVAIAAVVGVAAAASAVCFVTWRRAGDAVALDRTSRIATGANGSHLSLQGLTLDVEPESAVVLGSPFERGMLIVLDRGGIVCEVAPRSADAPLVIQAGSVQVKVVGTRFSVTRTGEKARVAVEHGVVEVAEGGHVARVGAGQVWPSEAPAVAPPQAAPIANPSDVPSAVEDGPESDVTQKGDSNTPRAPAKASGAAGGRHAGYGEAAQARFEAASALERSEPVRAVELYKGLENGRDSWAQHALYAHGRLEAARGNAVQARQLLERYLSRFPKGPNSADARSVLERLR